MILLKLEVEFSYVDVEQLVDYLLFFKLFGDKKQDNTTKSGMIESYLLWLEEMLLSLNLFKILKIILNLHNNKSFNLVLNKMI